MNYPEYVKVGDKKYKINTDFRIAIECNQIATDIEIEDYERALAIIYKLFGDEGLNDFDNHKKLLELGMKYLACGKEVNTKNTKEKPDMDYVQDMDYIEASFMFDYKIDLQNTKMHWWKFFNLLNGLSNSEFGNCCILSNIRNLRNMNLKEIKDAKQRQKIKEAQEMVALKKYNEVKYTQDELDNINNFMMQLGIERK